jgi:DNA-binding beta-propeller fold protein YncE
VTELAAGAGALWVSQSGERLLRVDPRSNRVVATLALANPAGPVVTASGVWLVCCWSGITTRHPAGSLLRVDPASNRVVARIRLPGLPTAVGADPGGVWVTGAGGPIWRVHPASGRLVATIAVPGGLGGLPGRTGPAGEVGDVLVGPDMVWVSNPASGQVLRVDPARNRLAGAESIHEGAPVGPSLVMAGGYVWATNWTILWALGNPARQVSLDELGGQDEADEEPVSDLAASPGAVWVGAWNGLFRVDLSQLR